MGIIIDIAITIIMAVIIITAYRAGFVKAGMGLVKSLVSFFAAYAFAPTLGKWISDEFLLKRISSGIAGTVRSLSETPDGRYDLDGMADRMDSALKSILSKYSVDGKDLGDVCDGVVNGTESHVEKVADFIASGISDKLSYCIAFIGLFIVTFVLLTVLTVVVDKIFTLPVLKSVNKVFGLLLGIAQALAFAFVFCTVAVCLLKFLGSIDNELFGNAAVERSVILRLYTAIFAGESLFGLI